MKNTKLFTTLVLTLIILETTIQSSGTKSQLFSRDSSSIHEEEPMSVTVSRAQRLCATSVGTSPLTHFTHAFKVAAVSENSHPMNPYVHSRVIATQSKFQALQRSKSTGLHAADLSAFCYEMEKLYNYAPPSAKRPAEERPTRAQFIAAQLAKLNS